MFYGDKTGLAYYKERCTVGPNQVDLVRLQNSKRGDKFQDFTTHSRVPKPIGWRLPRPGPEIPSLPPSLSLCLKELMDASHGVVHPKLDRVCLQDFPYVPGIRIAWGVWDIQRLTVIVQR